MFVIISTLIALCLVVAFVAYSNQKRHRWESLDRVWMQRIESRSTTEFIYRTSAGMDPTSLVPALWKIKKPFSSNPQYISQHPDQLRAWWEPLAIQFASLGRHKKTIRAIQFAPTLGIYVKIKASRKTVRPPEEQLVVLMLDEAQKTWKPRRFDVDSSYSIRQSLLQRWHIIFGAVTAVAFVALVHYRYYDFLGDHYYFALGAGVAFIAAVALQFWFYPKLRDSVHCWDALCQVGLIAFASLTLSLPAILVWANMTSLRTVCEEQVPVMGWHIKAGKSRTYHATLNLQACSLPVPNHDVIEVRRSQYQKGTTMNIRIYRGALGRYVLETQ